MGTPPKPPTGTPVGTTPKACAKAERQHHIPSGAGLILRGGHSINALNPGCRWHRSHGGSRERRILRHCVRGLQQFAADTTQWVQRQDDSTVAMAAFTEGSTKAMSQVASNMQVQANQLAFLANTVGTTRAEIEQDRAEMRRQMEKERAEMRRAMEASIQQRVADEAGD